MSLLVLADAAVAERDGERVGKVGIEVETQTEETLKDAAPIPWNLSAPIPSPVHDYTAQADSDVLVNLNHDYYHRVPVPEGECEHSYAFPVPNSYPAGLHSDFQPDRTQPEDYSLSLGLGDIVASTLRFEPDVIEEVLVNSFPQDNWTRNNGLEGVVSQDCDFHQLLEYIDEPGSSNDFEGYSCKPPQQSPELLDPGGQGKDYESHSCLWNGCSMKYTEKNQLFIHIKLEHCTKGGDLRCRWKDCGRSNPFIKRYLLERHVRSHSMEKPFECEDCDKTFTTKELLGIHRKRHSGIKQFECPKCQKQFVTSGARRKHFLTHLDRDSIICDFPNCSATFASRDALNKHKKRKKHVYE